MTKYNVHLYREMRLFFPGIEADSPEAAAMIIRDEPTGNADDLDDCDGETLTALVDVAGDDQYEQSVMVDFEGERQRKAAPKLLAALEAILPYAENEASSLQSLGDSPEAEAEAEKAWRALTEARAAIATAEAAGIRPAQLDIHALLASRGQIAAIWSIEDVQGIRPDLSEGQCWEVLENVGRKHDAEYGICWTTLEVWAQQLFGRAAKTSTAGEA